MGDPVVMPLPVALGAPLLEDQVERHRDLWCRRYDDCLAEAVKRDWKSWSCASCPIKGTDQEPPELRVGGDSALGQLAEDAAISKAPPSVTGPVIYERLSETPLSLMRIARGLGPRWLVGGALRRMAMHGIVEEVEKGWRRTNRRRCSQCKVTKPSTSFVLLDTAPDGRSAECRACRRGRKRIEERARRRAGG